jgi:hypothetical protein
MAVKAGGKRNRSTEHAVDEAKKVSKRTELSIEEKVGLLDWYHSNGRNQVSTVNHFKAIFPTLNQSTVSRMLKKETELRAKLTAGINTTAIRNREVKHPQFEAAMGEWISRIEQLPHSRLNGASIKEVATRFYDKLEILDEERLELSNGWLCSFQKRHGLKLFQFHGEAASTPMETLAPERERLQKEIGDFLKSGHSFDDIWNMDETSFFMHHHQIKALHVKLVLERSNQRYV